MFGRISSRGLGAEVGKMWNVGRILCRRYRAGRNEELIQALKSEIQYEESTNPFQNHRGGSMGCFVLEWDTTQSKDVFLRRKYGDQEEIAVSALLDPKPLQDSFWPMRALMKICIKIAGREPVLHFDCSISSDNGDESDFTVHHAYYLRSPSSFTVSDYKGPVFSSLDPQLKMALKEYLVARGIDMEFTNFILLFLHKKEKLQYLGWLDNLQKLATQ